MSVERLISRRQTRRRVTGWIRFADVRFDLDDAAGCDEASNLMHEHLPEKVSGDLERRAIVKVTGQ
jgi:hypothetical protein